MHLVMYWTFCYLIWMFLVQFLLLLMCWIFLNRRWRFLFLICSLVAWQGLRCYHSATQPKNILPLWKKYKETCLGKSPNAFDVSMYGVIVAIISCVWWLVISSVGNASSLYNCCVLCRFYLSWLRCPKCVAINGFKNFVINEVDSPGHD